MNIKKIAFLIALLSPFHTFGGSLTQTIDFRHFLYKFFNDAEYQVRHVSFPYTYVHYSSDEEDAELVTEKRQMNEWQHLKGPDHYRCKRNCFDLVIYDSFRSKHKESGERVLSFEGVENGINEVLYFKLIESEWYLVKHDSLSN